MACVSLRPRTSDRNGRIVEEFCVRPRSSSPQPAKPSRLLRGSRKMVVVKVEPSYISSDLFTPFSEPRSTLPSIAEFVRPSYGSEKTWGTVTSSYGGVGSACQLFKKRGQGSISRSHRHYGSGCINYCTHEEELDLHCTRKPAYKHEPAVLGATPPRQCEGTSSSTAKNVPLSVNTASALKSVCATLYGTSSYNNDFSSTLSPPDQKHSTQSTPIHHEITDTLDVPTLQEPPKNGESCGKCKFGTEDCHLQKNEGYQDQEIDDSCSSSDSNDDEESGSDDPEQTAASASNITSTTHGHMISISPCTNTLPSHVIVTSLSELPSHFRRVTTKYTRNRCPLLPCRVPHYLLRKHQLLLSVITKLPISKRSGQQLPAMTKDALILPAMAKSLAVNYHQSWSDPGKISATANDGQISAMSLRDAQFSATTKDTAVSYHANLSGFGEKPAATDDVNNGYVDNRLSHLVNDQEAGKNSKNSKDGKGSAISDLNGRHFHHHHHHHRDHLLAGEVTSKPVTQDRVVANGTTMQPEVKGRMRQHSHMTQHLGQKFKTDAHTRYHSLFPDQVPDLQTIEPAKRHTFFGYHTSVFRG